MLSADPDAVLERLRALCFALPDTDWPHVAARVRASYDLAAPRRGRRG